MGKPQIAEQLEKMAYETTLHSGEGLTQISGELKLHSIVVGKGTSGQAVTIFDASSGLALSGSIVGQLHCGTIVANPVVVEFDTKLESGMVLMVSGSTWQLTALYAR